ncbi:hypothetical protein [Streptomyces sodiiphilus]
MATADWLGSPPADEPSLTMWALARMASVAGAAGADAPPVRARVRTREIDRGLRLGGRFGDRVLSVSGPAEPRGAGGASAETSEDDVSGVPGVSDAEGPADPAVTALFDPAVLVRDFARVRAAPAVRLGRPCVALRVRPHPVWADPHSPWCPPGAREARLVLDVATGCLLEAELVTSRGVATHCEVVEFASAAGMPDGPAAVRGGVWRAPAPRGADAAGWALARMAVTLAEPCSVAAEVTMATEPRDVTFDGLPSPGSSRHWRVGVTGPDGLRQELLMGDGYDPQDVPVPVARLAELLTPGRVVSHLAAVSAQEAEPEVPGPGVHITASVRPWRTFPFAAWAPEDGLNCAFRVDAATGLLVRALLRDTSGDVLADYRCTVTGTEP